MKYEHIIKQMSLEDKARMMSGKNTWETVDFEKYGIPSMKMSDGPHGMRTQAGAGDHLGINASLPATCFPTAATVANSWDVELGEEIGETLADEAITMGVSVILGPGLNIKRSPLCGRNFEYFSEDPYLAGKMATAYVKGIQSKGVVACPKHFAVNSQETRRMAMNSVVDERTFREIYLTGFEMTVKEGKARSIMSAYNEINGIYANEDKRLLKDILVDEWGFDGYVVSDWGGSNDHALGVKNGSHLEMPGTGNSGMKDILKGIEAGVLTEDELDQRVDELLDVVFMTYDVQQKYMQSMHDDSRVKKYDVEGHHELARKAAEKSIVLLKNDNDILPISKDKKVLVLGDFATTPRYQGAGSSLVNTSKKPENLLEELQRDEVDINVIGYAKGYKRNSGADNKLLFEAVEQAKNADVVLICAGLDEISESEGLDRKHMRMPSAQNMLIDKVADVNANVVVVLSAGSVVEMPWIDKVSGVIHGYLAGQAGASAMAKALSGVINPSGKLNETYAYKYDDTPARAYWPSPQRSSEHREGIYVGYRYYDKVAADVLFPFGYGLSYTQFEYSDINITDSKVEFTIKNVGDVAGAEVAQLYVSKKSDTVYRPVKELKGFAKVELQPGESKTVEIAFDDKTFRYFDVDSDRFEIEPGEYEILIGASSRDIRLKGSINQEGTKECGPYSPNELPSYFSGDIKQVSDEEFAILYGREVPDGSWSKTIDYNDAVCQLYMGKGILGWIVCGVLTLLLKISDKRGKPSLNLLFQYNMPIRGYSKMTGGVITTDMAKALTEMANGHRIVGTAHFIKAAITRS
ncbi:MAG: glycoside hydrolase family 3 C-terminal domain-containing protein [Lachnospiraceae bacterium]|nr:glycoside hydrolase family 3 C-terminal domain-containing protein [Lachnospiraceae bacterium]